MMNWAKKNDPSVKSSRDRMRELYPSNDLKETSDEKDISGSSERTAANDRSKSMNPNNSAYKASMDNRANQLNPKHSASKGKR